MRGYRRAEGVGVWFDMGAGRGCGCAGLRVGVGRGFMVLCVLVLALRLVLLGWVGGCGGVLDLLDLVLRGHRLPGCVLVFHVFCGLRGLGDLLEEVVLRGVCRCVLRVGGLRSEIARDLWDWRRFWLVESLLKSSLCLSADP